MSKQNMARVEVIGPDTPIGKVANAMSGQAFALAANFRMSRWDLCVALANACGQMLADSEPTNKPPPGVTMPRRGRAMSREHALERMDSLREVMQGAYDLRSVKGEG